MRRIDAKRRTLRDEEKSLIRHKRVRRKRLAVAANKSFNLLNWENLERRMPGINLVSLRAFLTDSHRRANIPHSEPRDRWSLLGSFGGLCSMLAGGWLKSSRENLSDRIKLIQEDLIGMLPSEKCCPQALQPAIVFGHCNNFQWASIRPINLSTWALIKCSQLRRLHKL